MAETTEAAGLGLHYLESGAGPALILLQGYTQTSLAPDLPGIDDSEIPDIGLDMKNAAIRIHTLATTLGIERASIVGHDIGLMVA